MIMQFLMVFAVSSVLRWFLRALTKDSRKGQKIIILFCLAGTPIHELGHYLACKLFRVPVVELQLFDPGNGTGHVQRAGDAPHAFAALLIAFMPTFVALPLSLFLFQLLIMVSQMPSSDATLIGFVVLGWLILGILLQCAPSGADAGNFFRFVGSHKLQFVCLVAGCVIGYYITEELLVLPFEPIWLVLKEIVFFLPAFLLVLLVRRVRSSKKGTRTFKNVNNSAPVTSSTIKRNYRYIPDH